MHTTHRCTQSSNTPNCDTPQDQTAFIQNLYHKNVKTKKFNKTQPCNPASKCQQETPQRKSHDLRRFLISVAILLLLLLICCIGWIIYSYTSPDAQVMSSTIQHAQEDKSIEEIQNELNKSVAENMMNIQIAPILTVDQNLVGDIHLDNSAHNHVDQKLALLDTDGTCYFESEFISPGQSLGMIQLVSTPPQQTTMLEAKITGYDRTNHAEIGSMSVEIRYVQKGAQQ